MQRITLFLFPTLLLGGCGVGGDFENQEQFSRYLDELHLAGIQVADAKQRLADEGFSCSPPESQPHASMSCSRTRKRWYWMGYEGQSVTVTYDRDSGAVTSVHGTWGKYMS